ncbi:hypothetical protein BH23CHL5_BH23CHL5_05530 [soil metagenome]
MILTDAVCDEIMMTTRSVLMRLQTVVERSFAVAFVIPATSGSSVTSDGVSVAGGTPQAQFAYFSDSTIAEIVESQLSATEQKARVIALRGLSRARTGDLDSARTAFSEALQLDPELDLRKLPTFWRLSTAVHQMVADVFYSSGNRLKAAGLLADMRTKFRPRLLPAVDRNESR